MNCDFEIILSTTPEFLIIQDPQEKDLIIVSELGPRGDKGDKGDDGEAEFIPKSPVFSYDTEGKLTGIVYSDNSTKTFFYDSEGTLIKIESTLDSINYRKTFNHTNGVLTSILDETL
jgi:YD repeat-containing protein